MNKTEFSRLVTKGSSVSGITPTVNSGDTIDATWANSDILNREMFINVEDKKVFIRANNDILEFVTQYSGSNLSDYYLPLSGGVMDARAQISGATGNYLDLDFAGIGISLLDSPFTGPTSSNGLVIMPGFGNILNSVGETNTISGGETNIISGGETNIISGGETKIISSANTVITSSGNAYFIGEITSIVGNNRIEINSPNIYLNSDFSGTSIVNLGLDEFGNVTTGSTFNKYTTTTTLSAGNNTITHNLGITPVMVQVYDSAGVMVIPNEITLTSSSATTINVASTMTSARIIIIG